MSTIIEDVITSEAFRGDGPLTAAAVYALELGDDQSKREVRGLINGALSEEQEKQAWEHLRSLARRLNALAASVRRCAP